MGPRRSQDGNKMAPGRLQLCSRIAYGRGLPKIVKIGVSCKRGAISGMAMVQNCCTAAAPKPSPPQAPPTLRDRVGTTKHRTSSVLFRYINNIMQNNISLLGINGYINLKTAYHGSTFKILGVVVHSWHRWIQGWSYFSLMIYLSFRRKTDLLEAECRL